MLGVVHERLIFLDRSGTAEEVMSFSLTNSGTTPFSVGPAAVTLEFTDIETEYLHAVAPYETNLQKASDANRWTFAFDAHGEIEPSASHRFAVLVRRPNLAAVSDGTMAIQETSFNNEICVLQNGAAFERRVVVVFPPSPTERKIAATTATRVSSRTATWLESVAPARLIVARSRGQVPLWIAVLDDILANLYRQLAMLITGRNVAVSTKQDLDALMLAGQRELGGDFPLDRHCANSETSIRSSIELLWSVRENPRTATSVATPDSYMFRILDEVDRQVRVYLAETPMRCLSPDFPDVFIALQRFASDCGGGAQRRWGTNPKERDLHDELQRFLSASGLQPCRELQLSNGRLDLRVGEVPVELKVGKFSGDPAKLLEAHGQQAAEYAVRTRQACAVLLALDTSEPKPVHGPHLDDLIRVNLIQSAESATGTPVVAILIAASQIEPSALTGVTPKHRSPGGSPAPLNIAAKSRP